MNFAALCRLRPRWAFKIRARGAKSWILNEEFRTKKKELCIKNKNYLIENDELCRGRLVLARWAVPALPRDCPFLFLYKNDDLILIKCCFYNRSGEAHTGSSTYRQFNPKIRRRIDSSIENVDSSLDNQSRFFPLKNDDDLGRPGRTPPASSLKVSV